MNSDELVIVFDGPPGPEAGRFVECETPDGKSVNAGEWRERGDGLWELRVTMFADRIQSLTADNAVRGAALLRIAALRLAGMETEAQAIARAALEQTGGN